MKMIKIAYDYQIFGAQKYGGISRYFYELAKNLNRIEDCDVSLIAPAYINSYIEHNADSPKVIGHRAPACRGSWLPYRFYNILSSPRKIRALHPDIVHETYYWAKGSTAQGARTVLTVFDMIHELFPAQFRKNDKTAALKARAVSRADHVICISKETQSDLINILNIHPQKTSVIHLGFQLTSNHGQINTQILKRPYLLYVGNRRGYKNFEALLEMYGQNAQLRNDYDLVAFGGGQFASDEVETIKKLNISLNQVHQLEGNDSLLTQLYFAASVFVYPSLYEGFGIPPLEAMSLQCPVASSNAGAMPEVLGDAVAFFDPNSIESMTSAIENIINDGSYRSTLIARALEKTRQYSWGQCGLETLSVYKSLV
jgi:glycosyltransferase involved in cell wall biosynthesis